MENLNYKKELKYAGISGIIFLIFGFFNSLFFMFVFQILPVINIDINLFLKFYYPLGLLFVLIQSFLIYKFYKGYIILAEKFELQNLKKLAKLTIIFFIILYFSIFFFIPNFIVNINTFSVNDQNVSEQQAISFIYNIFISILFFLIFIFLLGVLNIFLGREILKLKDHFKDTVVFSGYSKIILGVAYASIFLSSIGGMFLLVSFITDIILFFEASNKDFDKIENKKLKNIKRISKTNINKTIKKSAKKTVKKTIRKKPKKPVKKTTKKKK